jgi:hypothetical protein
MKWKKARRMISVNRIGNVVYITKYTGAGGVETGCLADTKDGVAYCGDLELLKLYNGTRRGLIDDDKLSALYKSIEGGAKPKD